MKGSLCLIGKRVLYPSINVQLLLVEYYSFLHIGVAECFHTKQLNSLRRLDYRSCETGELSLYVM